MYDCKCLNDYTEIWQLQDAITTVVNACGYGIWNLQCIDGVFKLETNTHLDDATVNDLCCQLPLAADYEGEGSHGSMFTLYLAQIGH